MLKPPVLGALVERPGRKAGFGFTLLWELIVTEAVSAVARNWARWQLMIWLTNHGRHGHRPPFTLILKDVQFKSSFHLQHHLYLLCHLWYKKWCKKCTYSLIQWCIYLFSTICVPEGHCSSIWGYTGAKKIHQIFVIVELKQGKNDTQGTNSMSIWQNITELLWGFQIKVPHSEKWKRMSLSPKILQNSSKSGHSFCRNRSL